MHDAIDAFALLRFYGDDKALTADCDQFILHGAAFWVRPMVLELFTGAIVAGLYWWEIGQRGLLPESFRDFLAGRLGMECSFGLFGIPQMKTANLQFTVKPAPRWADADPAQISTDRLTISVSTRKPARTLVELVRWIDQLGVELADVQLRRPSLEDVYLQLTRGPE